jgi:hypothetical protein
MVSLVADASFCGRAASLPGQARGQASSLSGQFAGAIFACMSRQTPAAHARLARNIIEPQLVPPTPKPRLLVIFRHAASHSRAVVAICNVYGSIQYLPQVGSFQLAGQMDAWLTWEDGSACDRRIETRPQVHGEWL